MPLRVSALRSLGAYMNIFSIESFIDELAQAANADPVDFRLRHLDEPRARAVIKVAAERFGWADYQRRQDYGRGFAFARYKNLAAYLALATEVEVDRKSGRVRLRRAVAAVDCGEAVNPDGSTSASASIAPGLRAGTGAATRSCASVKFRTRSRCMYSISPARPSSVRVKRRKGRPRRRLPMPSPTPPAIASGTYR